MEFFKRYTKIDFMGKRYFAFALSISLVLISLGSLATRGLNFGIDFTGGTVVEVGYPQAVTLADVHQALDKAGFGNSIVQYFGTSKDVLIRVPPRAGVSQAEVSDKVLQALQQSNKSVEHRRTEYVGPQVGQELAEKGGLAMLWALLGILVYVSLRFEWRLATGAVIALVHDTIMTLGVFSLWQFDFDLSVLAAVLAVIGYSLNDTIVVFDRIRENFRRMRRSSTIDVMNSAINQTLSRTLMTSGTTLIVVFALFFLGGEAIHGFALVFIVGIITGTYSSIYVASALAMLLGVNRTDLVPVKKEGAELDNRP